MPLPLEEDKLMDLVEKAKDYCLMHGICMRQKDKFDRDALHFAPFCLFPSPFPSDEYYKAVNLQVIVNELMHKVSHDYDFLKESLKHTIQVDDFTGRLWKILKQSWTKGDLIRTLKLDSLDLIIFSVAQMNASNKWNSTRLHQVLAAPRLS